MTRKVDPVSTGRPHIPGYGIPTHTEGLLPWSFALERLEKARNYWVATTRPDGRPHTVPVWGVLVDGVVRLVVKLAAVVASLARQLQSGRVQSYYVVALIGIILLVAILLSSLNQLPK